MKQKYWPLKTALALVLMLSMVFASPSAFGTSTIVPAATENSQQKLDRLQKEMDEINKQIKNAQEAQADAKTQVDLLDGVISKTQDKMDVLNSDMEKLDNQIGEVTKQITEIEGQIKVKQDDFDLKYASFSDRMAAMYESGAPTKIEAFLTATDFSDFLVQAEMISVIGEEDEQALNALIKQMDEIKKAQADLQKKKADLDAQKVIKEASRKELEATASSLKANMEEANKQLKALAAATGEARETYSTKKDDYDDVLNEIANSGSAGTDGDGNVTGEMRWPMPGYHLISTYFNDISGFNGRRHGGIDVYGSGINGKDIVAADGGTVITSTYHYSFGNYVMIDHHNGLVTLYAHASRLLVRRGQGVVKGQAIAEVGSTGESSGPHLHFEVRKNGNRVNPFNYVSIP